MSVLNNPWTKPHAASARFQEAIVFSEQFQFTVPVFLVFGAGSGMISQQQLSEHLARALNSVGMGSHFHARFDLTDTRRLSDARAFDINRADATYGDW